MTVWSRGALLTARSAFPLGGSQGVARWAGVVARSGVPASWVVDWEGVRR